MTDKKILFILKDFHENFDNCFKRGICESFANYYNKYHQFDGSKYPKQKRLTLDNYVEMVAFFRNMLPPKQKTNNYCWRINLKEPRRQWLKMLILLMEGSAKILPNKPI